MSSQPTADPSHPLEQPPIAAAAALHSFKLRVMKLLLIFGTTAIVLIWAFERHTGHLSLLDRAAYPLMIVVFVGCLVAIQLRPPLLTAAEYMSFGTFALYTTVHLQRIIFNIESTDTIYSLATLAQWFPLVYTSAFIFFDTRRAVTVSVAIYLSFLLPVSYKLAIGVAAFATNDGYPVLLNLLTSHPVYIVVLSGIARLKSHFVQAKADAGFMTAAANIDYLTGVANRRAAAHELQRALAAARASGAPLSVALIDIDHFKRINDTLGHDVGDQALVDLAHALRGQLRQADTLGRWGGEEFVVISRSRLAEVALLAERLRTHAARMAMPGGVQLTLSVGVACARPGDTPESLVKRADAALYLAKQRGRDRVEVEADSGERNG